MTWISDKKLSHDNRLQSLHFSIRVVQISVHIFIVSSKVLFVTITWAHIKRVWDFIITTPVSAYTRHHPSCFDIEWNCQWGDNSLARSRITIGCTQLTCYPFEDLMNSFSCQHHFLFLCFFVDIFPLCSQLQTCSTYLRLMPSTSTMSLWSKV